LVATIGMAIGLMILPAIWPLPAAAQQLGSCTAVVSGAAGILNGIYPCSATVVYRFAEHAMEFTLLLDTPASGSLMRIAAQFKVTQYVVQPGTFTLGTDKVTGSVTLRQTAGPISPLWGTAPSASASADNGTLELQDLGPASGPQDKQTFVSPSGVITATLQALSGTVAQGTVSLQIRFQPPLPNQPPPQQ
jgi:hypothetical protein